MNIIRLSLVLLCLVAGGLLHSQRLSDVFDDGAGSRARSQVKFNVAGLYRGEALVGYEYFLRNQTMSLEAGLGVGLGFWNPDPLSTYIDSYAYSLDETTGGNSIYLMYKGFRQRASERSLYYFLQVKNQGFTFEDKTRNFRVNDAGFGIGYVYAIGQRFSLDAGYLVSFRFYGEEARQELEKQAGADERLSFAIPTLDIKVGYFF